MAHGGRTPWGRQKCWKRSGPLGPRLTGPSSSTTTIIISYNHDYDYDYDENGHDYNEVYDFALDHS